MRYLQPHDIKWEKQGTELYMYDCDDIKCTIYLEKNLEENIWKYYENYTKLQK